MFDYELSGCGFESSCCQLNNAFAYYDFSVAVENKNYNIDDKTNIMTTVAVIGLITNNKYNNRTPSLPSNQAK